MKSLGAFVFSVVMLVAHSVGAQERPPVEVYSVIEETEDGREIVVTRMALSLPGKPWSGVPGKGLDFPISESRFDTESGFEGKLSIFGKAETQLEVSKDQMQELMKLRKEFVANATEIVTKFIEERNGELTELDETALLREMNNFKENYESQLTEVLLPFQMTQLKQFAFAQRFKVGILDFFKLPEVKKELGISDGQLKKFDKIQKELAKEKRDLEIEYQRKKRELIAKGEKDTREVLTQHQQDQLEELTGLSIK